MLRLVTMGGLRIERDDRESAPHQRRSWLAMLAVIASAGEHGIPRDRLVAIFWPGSDEEHARQSARQALYGLRRDLGREVVQSTGSSLALEPTAISSDVAEFRGAVAAGDRVRAIAVSGKPFLDGFHLPGAPAFNRWAEEERSRIDRVRAAALMALATEASRSGRADEVVEWWHLLTEADPLNGRYAFGYLKALAARGDRAAALAFSRRHEAVIRRELEVDPDPDVRRLEFELRAMPTPSLPSLAGPRTGDSVPARVDHAGLARTAPLVPSPSRRPHRLWRVAGAAVAVFVVAIVATRDWIARPFRLSSPSSSVAAATTNSTIAYRFYEEGLRAYQQDDRASARRLMRAALVEDSGFAMAAYYEAVLAQAAGDRTPDGRHAALARRIALRLAHDAPDRERLIITANLLADDLEPGAVPAAESLAKRYPEDPASHFALGRALSVAGDWAGSVAALERTIALESRAGITPGACRVCEPLNLLGWVYQWYDSLDAVKRTAQRHLVLRSDAVGPEYSLATVGARQGDTTAAYHWFRRLMERNLIDRAWKLNLDLRLEHYERKCPKAS